MQPRGTSRNRAGNRRDTAAHGFVFFGNGVVDQRATRMIAPYGGVGLGLFHRSSTDVKVEGINFGKL